MTGAADVEPLPTRLRVLLGYEATARVCDYARANVAHATAAKDAEIHRLRAQLATAYRVKAECNDEANRQRARAERLAEALQWYVDNDDTNDGQEGNEFWLAGRDRARALLHEQENDHEQND